MGKQLSRTYLFLRKLGLNYSEEEYGQISLTDVFSRGFKNMKNAFLLKYLMNSALLEPISPRKLRPKVLRWVGCRVGKDVFIGAHVFWKIMCILPDSVHYFVTREICLITMSVTIMRSSDIDWERSI